MQDHSTEIILFLFGSALLLGLEAIKTEKWRSYVLWVLAASFFACGALWSFIQRLSPPVTGFVTSIATSPESWFVLFVLTVIWIVVSSRSKATTHVAVPPQPRGDSESEEDFRARIESRLEVIDRNAGKIWADINAQRTAHGSTQELAERVEQSNAAVNERFNYVQKMIAEVNNTAVSQYATFAGSFTKLGTEINVVKSEVTAKTVALQRAIEIEINHALEPIENAQANLADKIQTLSDQFHAVDLDLIFLLNFVVDSVTIRFYDLIISKSPLSRIHNPDHYDDPKEREQHRHMLEKYVSDVLGWLRPIPHIGKMAADVAKEGESEVDGNLNNNPPETRPPNVDPIALRRFMIPATQCAKLLLFLEWQRNELAAGLTAQRDGLVKQQTERKTAKMASLLKTSSSS
ncbi:MAG: hypothetical protein ABSA49_11090 [Rhizomicrobium sp.]|jgi:hypothetical protein